MQHSLRVTATEPYSMYVAQSVSKTNFSSQMSSIAPDLYTSAPSRANEFKLELPFPKQYSMSCQY